MRFINEKCDVEIFLLKNFTKNACLLFCKGSKKQNTQTISNFFLLGDAALKPIFHHEH